MTERLFRQGYRVLIVGVAFLFTCFLQVEQRPWYSNGAYLGASSWAAFTIHRPDLGRSRDGTAALTQNKTRRNNLHKCEAMIPRTTVKSDVLAAD